MPLTMLTIINIGVYDTLVVFVETNLIDVSGCSTVAVQVTNNKKIMCLKPAEYVDLSMFLKSSTYLKQGPPWGAT